MIPLSDLRHPVVELDWHEAVAVTASVAMALWEAGGPAAPGFDAAAILPDGSVRIVGPQTLPGPAAAGVAAILDALLESTPCPAELRQLVAGNLGDSPEETLEGFLSRLMFFERPGRDEVMAALAARAAAALERYRTALELERITERARNQRDADVQGEPEAPARPIPEHARRRATVPGLAVVAVSAALAFALASYFMTAESPAPASTAQPDAPEYEELPEVPLSLDGVSPSPEAGPPPPRPREARPAGPAGSPAPPAASGPAEPEPGREPAIDVRVTEKGGAPLPVPASAPPPPAPRRAPAGAPRVYTTGDPGVRPPVLIRPHLPAEPPSDVPPEQVGTLELTISESGGVDQVRLISPLNRYQERMLVAAAKAWHFEPAMKDGRPVRFRMRIRVTL